MSERITAEDRAAALGGLFRGVTHEIANTLNAILMNAQLGMLSADEAQESLRTITEQARTGGQFLKSMSAFAGANTLEPSAEACIKDCIGLARKLLGSRVRRSGVNLTIEQGEAVQLPLDPFGAAVTIALLIDLVCDAQPGAANLRVARTEPACVVELSMDNAGWDDAAGLEEQLAVRFARQLAGDHGGSFELTDSGWLLTLPRGERA